MNSFKDKLLNTIDLCEKELQARKSGIKGESTVEQLEDIIIPELYQVLQIVEKCQQIPKEQRYLNSFANAFTVWGWNMQKPTEIFVLITELNNLYKNLFSKDETGQN